MGRRPGRCARWSNTLATRPAVTSHRDLTRQQRTAAGIPDGMVRVACGLEDADDLQADLARALSPEP